MAGLVLEVLLPSVRLVAVSVCEPTVSRVTVKSSVPAISAALAGRSAAGSLDVMLIKSAGVLTGFQLGSTALTVTLKAPSTFAVLGVPVLPVNVPGAALSPGTSNCSFAYAAAITLTGPLTTDDRPPAASVAVIVRAPALLKVKLDKVRVPATRVRLTGAMLLSSAMLAFSS